MKRSIIKLLIVTAIIAFPLVSAIAAPPPPPPPGGGGGDIPIGGTAPIGSGVVLLITMGAAYGAKKVYDARKRLEE